MYVASTCEDSIACQTLLRLVLLIDHWTCLDKCLGKLDDLHKKIVDAQVTQMLHYRCHDMSRGKDPLLVLKLLDGYEKFL